MKLTSRLIIILLLALSSKAWSTHIVGGEIYYDCLGNYNYRITLKVYRDCLNGQAPFDDPATIGVFDSQGNLINSLSLNLPGSTMMPVTQTNPCFGVPQANVCVEEAIYTTVVNLPPIPGGHYLAYQRCCRNGTILNLSNPGSQGATYMAHIPDVVVASCNSSPRYNNFPPIAVCVGVPLIFDHSATDPDADSLAYELCDPYDGGDQSNPMPVPPAAPPYPLVIYNSPYTGQNPMSSNPALSIDPVTGMLTGTPNMLGQWVVGVCVKEYRNGVLLSTNKRDFQFNVVNCQPIPVAAVPNPQQDFCIGATVNFTENSTNAMFYHWDFGDPSVTIDTSNLESPSYTFNNYGTYNVMLIVNPNTVCVDTGYTSFSVQPLLQPIFTPPPPQCVVGNSYAFSASGNFAGTGTFGWSFGSGSTPPASGTQNPSGISYSTAGTFPVTLTVTENGCTESYTDSVLVYPMPSADFKADLVGGCVPYEAQFSDSSFAATPISYLWNFGDGQTSIEANPSHVYTAPGAYTVTLIVSTTNGCISTDTFTVANMVTVQPKPVAGFTADPLETSIFNPDITVTDQSLNSAGCSYWWGNGGMASGTCDLTYAYGLPGTYQIMQVVHNEYGCTDTAYVTIEILPEFRFWIPNSFTPNSDGLNDIFKPSIMGVDDYKFMIFDRWGEMIFTTGNPQAGWNGNYKGDPCQEDVYVYRIMFRDQVELKEHHYIGHVTLIR
jgi:gliding motility-associated-like protein